MAAPSNSPRIIDAATLPRLHYIKGNIPAMPYLMKNSA